MNSTSYCKMLETPLLAFIEGKSNNINDVNSDLNYIFQQDNAPCHRARATKIWFENNNIDCMNWPPLSPDLNPAENLWADTSRKIYRDKKQFNNIQDLHLLIYEACSSITPENLLKCVNGMQKRMIDVVKERGDKINK